MKFFGRFLLLVVVAAAVGAVVYFSPIYKEVQKKIFYPTKYGDIVEQEAEKNDLDPNLVYAIIKTESGFDPMALSHAGAKGLMQLTDETFGWMIDVTGSTEEYSAEDLYDPQINIKFGCVLLKRLMLYYENSDTALCAYNAGIGNVSGWLEDTEYSADGITLTKIPFPETENYIKKVNSALKMYRELYN